MAGLLRKFRKHADVEHPAPSKPVPVDSPPPSLPPLFARFATSSSLLDSCTMPPQDEWDPWKVLAEPPPELSPVPSPEPPRQPLPVKIPEPPKLPPLLPVGRRKYTGPGLLPQVKLADPDAHPIRAVSTRQDHLSPMTPRHPSKFATHPSQQANQVLSYPPPASQTHFTQTQISPPPSKPGSSSSSSSNHTDATRFTHSSSSAFTSTSSIAPAIKHLDVTRPQGRSQSTSVQPQRLAANLIKPVSPPSRSLTPPLPTRTYPLLLLPSELLVRF
ncbi:uncharacterized protein F5147DRAFT_404566 [Suillus discolor]|uniref:Uncharacterized protein n=1 Tax=Suillus discolor TaxID=1912936 RepID=A0A9P7JP93_9AGAM|nr:uncharacterized protein F5147DRAFT_404566 [Suillus discolor]KAG2095139.1 hypothetical protein F5147DRAFT_404566 [Suillus discolor]